MTRAQAWNLYTTHILSTWNAWTYKCCSTLYIGTHGSTGPSYPKSGNRLSSQQAHIQTRCSPHHYDTEDVSYSALTSPTSKRQTNMTSRGIFNTTASICFSSLLGIWIDRAPSRLRTLLTTIFANRCAVLLACACWVFLIDDQSVGVGKQTFTNINPSFPAEGSLAPPKGLNNSLFTLAVFIGTLEKLSGVANMICMERDWIPILAPQASSSTYDLTHLNASM